ncbi:ferredoxin-type protein NapF [Parasedimentitalea maritima]|uniref:Ferredoxin-type protein NapF n=2 Tax=Parasedimentitalea maritima TaxID=2578117 RepID=A0A6A4RGH8_9RHOB|nr:ferredoxin-type protein NapF [Zongyanglinia marina]
MALLSGCFSSLWDHPQADLMQQRSFPLRRALFQRSGTQILRPPWSSEQRVLDGCTSCGACLKACPEAILIAGPAGTPKVGFTNGGCTFCGDCVDSCPEAETVFAPRIDEPWAEQGGLLATIGDGCMLSFGISCQICTDSCEPEALRLDLSVRPVGRIKLDTESCTGCGACIEACPEQAISTTTRPSPAPSEETKHA